LVWGKHVESHIWAARTGFKSKLIFVYEKASSPPGNDGVVLHQHGTVDCYYNIVIIDHSKVLRQYGPGKRPWRAT
jgi:hypothetical protein